MAPARKKTTGKSKAKVTAAPVPRVQLPKAIPVAPAPASGSEDSSEGSESSSDTENPKSRGKVGEVRNVKNNKQAQPLASSSAKLNTRPPAVVPGKPVAKTGKSGNMKKGKKAVDKDFNKRALRYHILKREILAAFMTKLLMRSNTHMNLLIQRDDDGETINMDICDSNSDADSRHNTSIFRTTVASSSQDNTSIFRTTVASSDDDNESRASYQDDWRSREVSESFPFSESE